LELIKELAGKFAEEENISETEALDRLMAQALSQVYADWAGNFKGDSLAEEFLSGYKGTFVADDGEIYKYFAYKDKEEFESKALFSQHILDYQDMYDRLFVKLLDAKVPGSVWALLNATYDNEIMETQVSHEDQWRIYEFLSEAQRQSIISGNAYTVKGVSILEDLELEGAIIAVQNNRQQCLV
jgi:hypothetical protein